MTDLPSFRDEIRDLGPGEIIAWARDRFGEDLVCASSMGVEDQVITHLIADQGGEISIFTLDTGRLFQETYDLIETTQARYSLHIDIRFPDAEQVEAMVREGGPNLFYRSVEDRKRCCNVRKVRPLRRALAGRKAWITGLRRSQSSTRQDTEAIDWDEANGLYKISPLVHWTEDEVWNFVRKHDVPYHEFHERGYPSIGCAPCTRAVKPGGDIRSGRWWWELPDGKECGIHGGDADKATEAASDPAPFGIRSLDVK